MISKLTSLSRIFARLGVAGTIDLLKRKRARAAGYKQMLSELKTSRSLAGLKAIDSVRPEIQSDPDVIEQATTMLRDQNRFFSFPYKTRNIWQPWAFDPLENKHWPKRHYTEALLHAADTPRDAKIVWEINRFKDLPTLAQAAYLTRDTRYPKEIEARLASWTDDNPVGQTINWASALEISIRLLSWTATLELLRLSGYRLHEEPWLQRSVFEHIRYLAGDLSTDRVVPTNHLIGEAAGLYVATCFFDLPDAERYRATAKEILEKEILRQTYEDGATREASSWYHQFVTHFFDLADRASVRTDRAFSKEYKERLARMKAYLAAMTIKDEVVRFGDADDGWAIYFAGKAEMWKQLVFGQEQTLAAASPMLFQSAQHFAAHHKSSFLFLRAGEYGMGGAGFSSHAHNDLLSPILYLAGLPILVDPGTYVYNGDPNGRRKYRGADAHNGLVLPDPAVQRMNFGWHSIRPSAKILDAAWDGIGVTARAQYGEWPQHERLISLESTSASILDIFHAPLGKSGVDARVGWHLHLAPIWLHEATNGNVLTFGSENARLTVTLKGQFEDPRVETYDYSPSYRVEIAAQMIATACAAPEGSFEIGFSLQTR